MENKQFLLCPVCHGKTRLMIRRDTVIRKFPLLCPKCKQETLIDICDGRVYVVSKII